MPSEMEGSHRAGRSLKDVVVGSKAEAAAQRERAQHGAAAAGRRGQAVQLKRAHKTAEAESKEERAISEDVMLVSCALVMAGARIE